MIRAAKQTASSVCVCTGSTRESVVLSISDSSTVVRKLEQWPQTPQALGICGWPALSLVLTEEIKLRGKWVKVIQKLHLLRSLWSHRRILDPPPCFLTQSSLEVFRIGVMKVILKAHSMSQAAINPFIPGWLFTKWHSKCGWKHCSQYKCYSSFI